MREAEWNPYVVQIDKFVHSLDKLFKVVVTGTSPYQVVTEEEYGAIREKVKEKICQNCDRKEACGQPEELGNILYAIEGYGADLNKDMKREILKKCVHGPRLLKEVSEAYGQEKKNRLWKHRMEENRVGCMQQLDTFAHMILHSTKELGAAIFEDDHLEKRIKNKMRKEGLKVLSTVFFVTESGRYEIHVTLRAQKGECVASRAVAEIVSDCVGRDMILEHDERPVVGHEYCTIVCLEGPAFYTMQGVAKIGKGCETISGDSFSMLELPGGKQGVILSDGMGAGREAFLESSKVVEVLEELLGAGFPETTALQMLNTAMVMSGEEVHFSTIDMTFFDLYSGECEMIKAGASATFIKTKNGVEKISSASLPVGVVPKLEEDHISRKLEDGDFLIMVTDGVMDALPVGVGEEEICSIIEKIESRNPKEVAHAVLEQVLMASGEIPLDDMTVLAIGMWCIEK